ncbi:MAG: late competence development ComFB family protein [Hylemonella sp.]|nr:late competence development ComFB family protein [Hylemonella sp.]MDH5708623.1 late competence development ComFB family protein [Hylemonella sp.]
MSAEFDQVHNYYEHLVFAEVVRRAYNFPELTADVLSDVACVALNQLPPRYVRHDVDLEFYMVGKEREDVYIALVEAVEYALNFVRERESIGDSPPSGI